MIGCYCNLGTGSREGSGWAGELAVRMRKDRIWEGTRGFEGWSEVQGKQRGRLVFFLIFLPIQPFVFKTLWVNSLNEYGLKCLWINYVNCIKKFPEVKHAHIKCKQCNTMWVKVSSTPDSIPFSTILLLFFVLLCQRLILFTYLPI